MKCDVVEAAFVIFINTLFLLSVCMKDVDPHLSAAHFLMLSFLWSLQALNEGVST